MMIRKLKYLLNICLITLGLSLVGIQVQAASPSTDLRGAWVGGYEMGGEWHFVEARFESAGADMVGGLDFRFDQRVNTFLDTLTIDEAGQIQMSLEKDDDPLTFTGQIQADSMLGQAKHGEQSGPFHLSRVYELDVETYQAYIGNYQLGERTILLTQLRDYGILQYFDTAAGRTVRIYPLDETRFFSEMGDSITVITDADGRGIQLVWRLLNGRELTAPRANIYNEEAVRYKSGDITLAGTLLTPLKPGPHPAIVMMHGSNPNNRDNYRMWAHYFAQAGIAALVYDKPGAFDSTHPSLRTVQENSAQSLADAVIAGVNFLQARPEINAAQVGIWTFSNSSWAGPLAASQSDDIAFIISTAASGVAQRQADYFQDDLNKVSYSGYDYPAWARATSFRYLKLTREFSIFAREYNLPIPTPVRDYYGQDFDPLTAWRDIAQPVLVINGQYDTLVDPIDGVARFQQTLNQKGHTDYTLVILPNADHVLRQTKTGLTHEGRGGRDQVFVPGSMAMMTDWVLDRFDGQTITIHNLQEIRSPVPVQISAHFEPGGRYDLLPWYGQPEFQVLLWLIFVIIWLSALLTWPVTGIINLMRHRPVDRQAQVARLLGWLTSLLNAFLFAGLIVTWIQIVHIDIGRYFGLSAWLYSLPALALVAVGLVIATLYFGVQVWRKQYWSLAGRVHYTVVMLVGILSSWHLAYWQLL